jgi:hypothetical protein
MLWQETVAQIPPIQNWPIERLVEYPRNPRINDKAVDRMCGSINPRLNRADRTGFKLGAISSPEAQTHTTYSRKKGSMAHRSGFSYISPITACLNRWRA